MALQDDFLRAQLIKQFEADVLIVIGEDGSESYVCPTCRRHVARSYTKCQACEQALKWDSVKRIETERAGMKKASITFEVPGDFVKSDCRKCPISYIARRDSENIYDCPLNKRSDCPLIIE